MRLLQNRIRQLGLADFLDVNVPAGKLITQLQLIKRLINNAGVSDLLEVNLDRSRLTEQLHKISSVTQTIPVGFNIAKLPKLGPTEPVTVPVRFDVGKLPVLGPVSALPGAAGAAGAAAPPTASGGAGDPLTAATLGLTGATDRLTNTSQSLISVSGRLLQATRGLDITTAPLIPATVGLDSATDELTAATLAATRHAGQGGGTGFDIGKVPQLPSLGATENIGISVTGITSAAKNLADLTAGEKQAADAAVLLARDTAIASVQTMLANATVSDMGRDLLKLDTALKDTAGIWRELAAADQLLAGQSARVTQNFTDLARAQNLGAQAARGLAVAATGAAGRAGAGGGGIAGLGWAFGGTIGGVSLWHIAIDGVIEALIAVGLAAAAAAAGIAVMAPAAQDIYTQLKAVQTVNSSLGSQIPPLTGQFQALAQAMAPQVIEAYGGALTLVSGQVGTLQKIAPQVVNLFDTWIAKMDLFAQGQSFQKFLQSGIGYLTQFGSILGTLGQAFNSLLSKDPGIAHFLLDIIGGLASLLKLFSGLPGPVVAAVLALHGLYLWGRVMGGILLTVAGSLAAMGKNIAAIAGPMLGLSTATGKMAGSFLGLSAVSWGWVGVAVVALGALAYELTQASAGAKAFITNLEQGLAGTDPQQLMAAITTQVGGLSAQIFDTQLKAGELVTGLTDTASKSGALFASFARDIPQSLASWGNLNKTVNDLGGAVVNAVKAFLGFQSAGPAIAQSSNDIKLYRNEITKLLGEQDNLFKETGLLVTQGFTWSQALALESLAGVKASDSFEVMRQKVANLITGYQTMSIQGAILANSVNAITFASLQQQSNITQLNSAWTTFITTVTGGQAAFSTFELQVGTIASALSGVTPAATAGATSLGGLSTASLQAGAAFVQGVTNANSLVNALTLQASAAGLGAHGTDMLTAAVKDTVAQLIPMAGSSVTAQASLIALAQQGGFPAGQSFQQLNQWVGTASGTMASAGKSGGPATQLNSILGTLATASSNLTTDIQNLSTALGTQLSSAMATAIIVASGGQKPFNDFANAVLNAHGNSDGLQAAANALGNELVIVTGSADLAKQQFQTLAIGGLHLTKDEADTLWGSFARQYLITNAGSAAEDTKAKFETLAGQLGLTKQQADDLWTSLRNVAGGSPYTASLTETGQGTFIISGNVAPTPSGGVSLGQAVISGKAAGALIRQGTTPTADDVLIRVSKGETVVSAVDSRKLAPTFAAMGIPGYAAGGSIGGLATQTTAFHQDFVSAMTSAMEAAMTSATQAAKAAAQAAAAAKGTAVHVAASGNVIQWLSQAIALTGAPASWLPDLEVIALYESGDNPNAINLTDSNAAAGDPSRGLMQTIMSTFLAYHQPGTSFNIYDPVANASAAINYIRARYGDISNVPGIRSIQAGGGYVGYAAGGLIPGYAAGGLIGRLGLPGGSIASKGAFLLRAWEGNKSAGTVNAQIDHWTHQQYIDSTLAGAGGLSKALRAKYVKATATDKKNLATLGTDKTIMQQWRTQLSGSDDQLRSWIGAAGSTPALKKYVTAWKKQLSGQQATINKISMMLGLSAAQIAANAANAAAARAAAAANAAPAGSAGSADTSGSGAASTPAAVPAVPMSAAQAIALLTGTAAAPAAAGAALLGTGSGSGAIPALGGLGTGSGGGFPALGGGASAWPGLRGWGGHRMRGGHRHGWPGAPGYGGGGYAAGGGDDQMLAELRQHNALLEQLIQVNAAIPARTGQHVGAAVNGAAAGAAFQLRYPGSR